MGGVAFSGFDESAVSTATKCRFDADKVPFRRPQKYTLTAAEVRFAYSIPGRLENEYSPFDQ